MRTLPTSLDGSEGDVLDEYALLVATFAVDDQRIEAADPVYVVFENRDVAWEERLMTGAGHGLHVSLRWRSGHRLDHVAVLDPYPLVQPQSPVASLAEH